MPQRATRHGAGDDPGRPGAPSPPPAGDGWDRSAATGDDGATVDEVVRAGGGIVLRAGNGGGWEVVVVHRPQRDDWTLPKGKLEPGERTAEAALREVAEETGLTCELGRYVGEVEYEDRRGRRKVVAYFLMQPVSGTFAENDEVDELRWLPIAEAVAQLSYPHDRDLLASVGGSVAAAPEH